jgi:hypothetical protein
MVEPKRATINTSARTLKIRREKEPATLNPLHEPACDINDCSFRKTGPPWPVVIENKGRILTIMFEFHDSGVTIA